MTAPAAGSTGTAAIRHPYISPPFSSSNDPLPTGDPTAVATRYVMLRGDVLTYQQLASPSADMIAAGVYAIPSRRPARRNASVATLGAVRRGRMRIPGM